MTKPGPKGKTKEELRASGSWREPVEASPDELENPQSGRGSEAPPEWLNKKEVKIWHELLPKAQKMKTYKDADHNSFGQFCRALHRLLEIQILVAKHGDIAEVEYQVGTGKDKKFITTYKESGFMKAEKLRQDAFNQYANQFGFNPKARTTLKIVPYDKVPSPSVPNPDAPPIKASEYDDMMTKYDGMMGIKPTT